MRILVCGGRDFNDWDFLSRYMTKWYVQYCREECIYDVPDVTVISGMAKGVDSMAVKWANILNFPVMEFPADWNKHGKAAGPIRNQQMLDEGQPDLVVAFPGGVGTQDMVHRAKKAGVEVIEVKYGL